MIGDGLSRIVKCEILSDEWSRLVYSMDASHYQIKPALVAYPRDTEDLQSICNYASNKNMSVTARGAGTGLLGQSLSDNGLVLDFTKHMNQILEVADNYVIVQPGIIKSILDKELKKKGKFLPPDPASSNYCTIGGMIANNSSGVHCLGFGNTIDFIKELQLVYADGTSGYASKDRMDSKMDSLKRLLGPNIDLINARFPKVSKNSCGYRLDACLKDGFEPNRVIAASEGTLALVTSAKMRIIDLPQYRLLMVLGFDDILAAVRFVPAILESSSPVALEMLDASVLRVAGKKESGCLLYVEFAGDDPAKVDTQMQNCRDKLTRMAAATSSTSVKVLEYATDDASMAKIWAARKAALGTTMNLTVGSRRPIGLIEDTVVYPKSLEEHITNLIAAYQDNKLDYVFYGHVGDGNIHTRPLVDVSSKSQFEMISALASRVFGDVIARGGTITGEHGDGLARVQYIELMYGKKITALFQVVKELFDPSYVLNPGKKVPFKSKGPT